MNPNLLNTEKRFSVLSELFPVKLKRLYKIYFNFQNIYDF